MFAPESGDIVYFGFHKQRGREVRKTRSALVISPYKYNLKSNLALFLPITIQMK